MSSPLQLASLGAFFVAGLLGSFHCLGMCGPLSMVVLGKPQGKFLMPTFSYHGARILSYALLGALLSLVGMKINQQILFSFSFWLLVLALVLYLFGFVIPIPPGMIRLQAWTLKKISPRAPWIRGMLLGLFSPLLPCGLLYAILAASLSAGSSWQAAAWMAAFALGTIPLLAGGQIGMGQIPRFLNPRFYPWILRGYALVVLAVLFYFHFHGHGNHMHHMHH